MKRQQIVKAIVTWAIVLQFGCTTTTLDEPDDAVTTVMPDTTQPPCCGVVNDVGPTASGYAPVTGR